MKIENENDFNVLLKKEFYQRSFPFQLILKFYKKKTYECSPTEEKR